jgi:16S rRNA (guanine527-N7)-methyltransferase
MEEKDFLKTLSALTVDYGITLSTEQGRMCHTHIALMLAWNRRCNLTRITDPNEIIEKHLLDSLIPARWLPQAGPAVDIGSGPGFPGIPIKIFRPKIEMLLLESQRKKVSFLKVVLGKLGVQNLKALQGRWEEFVQRDRSLRKHSFVLATIRAVRLEPEHVLGAAKILEREGLLAWWAGPAAALKWENSQHELIAKAGMNFEEPHSYTLPSASQPRRLFIWRRR